MALTSCLEKLERFRDKLFGDVFIFGRVSENSGLPESASRRNLGCELTHDVQAVFKTNAMVFYSQMLMNNSLVDVKRLVSNLTAFISQCCMPNVGNGCFVDKSRMFIDRVCEDHLSQLKDKDISECCSKRNPHRYTCFQAAQHGPPANMTEIYKFIPYWELCLLYIADQRTFMEQQLYDVSRQYRIFPPRVMAKIIIASKRLYSKCCKESSLFNCFIEMELHIQNTVTNVINESNKICVEYKNTGAVKTILWGIQYYTLLHPTGPMAEAVTFASSYEQFSSKCCIKTEWTANCFLDENEVLLLQFCSKSSSPAHLACCHETGQKRSTCLNNIASQESQLIPGEIRLTPEQLCKFSAAPDGGVIIWYLYEYTRRHRQDNLDMVLNLVSEFESDVKLCCQKTNNQLCFSSKLTNPVMYLGSGPPSVPIIRGFHTGTKPPASSPHYWIAVEYDHCTVD
ncbi:albumin-like [Pelodytes ibericus]